MQLTSFPDLVSENTETMRDLRLTVWWLTAGWLMVFGLIVGLLGPTIDYPMPSYSDKIEHALSFFILTCWFSGIYKRQAFPWLALALIIFAAATEYLQLALAQGRFGDVLDFMADVAGIGIGLIFALAGLDRWCAWIEARILR